MRRSISSTDSGLRMCLVDEARDLRGHLGLHACVHVSVLLQRERGRLVAQALADHLDRYAGLQREGGVSMADVMHSDSRQPSLFDQPFERLARNPKVAGSVFAPAN